MTAARGGALTLGLLARIVVLVAAIVAGLIVLGILLVVLEANPDNGIVSFFTDIAEWLASPFEDMFTIKEQKGETALNWGIAAVVYFVVGSVIARLLRPRRVPPAA
jgi:hypothetical protein